MDERVVRKLAEALERGLHRAAGGLITKEQGQDPLPAEALLLGLLVAQCETIVLLEDIKQVDDDILQNLRIISGMPDPNAP